MKMTTTRTFMSGVAASALVLGMAAPAAAQNNEAPQARSGNAPIIVTAQKREQGIQDVPISMEVVSGETLADFAINDFQALSSFLPNVQVQTTAGNDAIYIRGFGSPPANLSFDQSVSLYVDGIYAGNGQQTQAPFFDIERVEVLRGPQGALFGKNTAAGAVSIVSAGPTDEFSASLTGSYDFEYEGFEFSGHVSTPITDTLSVRLAGRLVDNNGFIDNLATGERNPQTQQQLIRFTGLWEPSPNFDFTLRAEYGNQEIRGGISIADAVDRRPNLRQERFLQDGPLGEEGIDGETLLVSGTANIQLGDYTLTSITGYSWFNANIVNGFDQSISGGGVVSNDIFNSFPQNFEQFSQEVRLLSPTGGTLEYVVGAYYDTSDYHMEQITGFDLNNAVLNYFGILNTIFDQEAESYSLFGQATLNVSDSLRFIGSLRYTHTSKDATFDGRLLAGAFALRPLTQASGSRSESNLDPSITAQYDISDDVMIYATYGRGSKTGGFVGNTYGTTDASFQFEPERSENYEAGIRSTFDEFTVNVSVYDTSFKNLQVSVYNPTIQTFQTGNAASAASTGIEATLIWNASENFNIQASGAYQDIRYLDFPGAACLATQSLADCDPSSPASIALNNLAGVRPSNVSNWSGSVQANAWLPLTESLRLDVTGIISARSGFFNSDNQDPNFGYQEGYAKVDMRVQVGDMDGRWHLAFVGRNLTNVLSAGSSFNLPFPVTGVSRSIHYLEPARSLAIEAGVSF